MRVLDTEQQQCVSAVLLGDTYGEQDHAEPPVLDGLESLVHAETAAIERHHLGARGVCKAGGQTSWLLDALFLHVHHRAYLSLVRHHQSMWQG